MARIQARQMGRIRAQLARRRSRPRQAAAPQHSRRLWSVLRRCPMLSIMEASRSLTAVPHDKRPTLAEETREILRMLEAAEARVRACIARIDRHGLGTHIVAEDTAALLGEREHLRSAAAKVRRAQAALEQLQSSVAQRMKGLGHCAP